MGLTRRLAVGFFAGAGVLLAWSAWSWACTPPLYVHAVDTADSEGLAGSTVRLVGAVRSDDVSPSPIEFHWRAKTTGAEIQYLKTVPAQKADGEFMTTVQVPSNASPGVYLIVAFAEGKESLGAVSTAYRVLAPETGTSQPVTVQGPVQTNNSADGSFGAAQPSAADPTQAQSQGNTTQQPQVQGTTSPQAQPQGGTAQSPPQAQGSTSGAATGANQPPRGGAQVTSVGSSPTEQQVPVAGVGQAGATPSQGGATPSPTPTSIAVRAVAGAGDPAPVATAGGTATSPARATADPQSPRTAFDDLWSGLRRAPSLSPTSGHSAALPSGTSPLVMGMGFFAAGLLLIGLGFGLAEAQRRRAFATE